MNFKSDSLTYFIVTADIVSFVDHKLFLGQVKSLAFTGSRYFKGPVPNFGFDFTENLHCALIPSQLN